MFTCKECLRRFSRRYDLNRHISHFHGAAIVEKCLLCGQLFKNCQDLQEHYGKYHKPGRRFVLRESAFKRNLVTFRYNFLDNETNFDQALINMKNLMMNQIMLEAAQKLMIKVSLIFFIEMSMTDLNGDKLAKATIPLRAPSFMTSGLNRSLLEKNLRNSFQHHRNSMEEFMRNGSNWVFNRALAYDIEVAKLKPIRIGGNSTQVDIKHFKHQRYLYNPPNKDNKCFLYCIAYFLIKIVGSSYVPDRVHDLRNWSYVKEKAQTFNTKKITFPVSVEDVKRFLSKNKHLDLKINILHRTTDEEIIPLEFGLGDGHKIVNLLQINTRNGSHFMLIKDVDKYLRQSYRCVNSEKLSYQKSTFCLHCLNSFKTDKLRDEHLLICSMNKPRKEVMPADNEKIIKFKNVEHQFELELIAFLDFECVLPDIKMKCPTCDRLKCRCPDFTTQDLNLQEPITYSFLVLGPQNEIIHERTHSSKNAHVDFLKHLLEQEENWIKPLLATKKDMIFSKQDEKKFERADSCYMCGKNFRLENIMKCRDHSHSTGHFLGAACNQCNLRRQRPRFLKVFLHNASKYDMHFIVKGLAEFPNQLKNISVLPYNGEHFRTLRFNSFQFLDSLAFLPTSLSQLSKSLADSNHNYGILKQTYLVKNKGQFSQQRLEMVLHKSFFPYEYCSSYAKMVETKALPKRKDFYSSLTKETLSKEDYDFARTVWNEFKCRNLLDYAEVYCKIDTLLLAEIFSAFRTQMHHFSGLDPAYYISLPAYAYDSMLKITKSEIELPTDINMLQFLEQAKRGGVSFINHRHLKIPDNQPEDYPNQEIVFIDANNLYGQSSMSKLPLKDFRWLNQDEIEAFDLTQDFNQEKGFIIECDLNYPKQLHRTHSNFPVAAEMLEINYDHLSAYSQAAVYSNTGSHRYKDVKLMNTLHHKRHYVTHIQNLMLYLSLGLKLIKIHRVLEFTQNPLLAPYIKKTNQARQRASSKFQTDLFKLMVSKKMQPF